MFSSLSFADTASKESPLSLRSKATPGTVVAASDETVLTVATSSSLCVTSEMLDFKSRSSRAGTLPSSAPGLCRVWNFKILSLFLFTVFGAELDAVVAHGTKPLSMQHAGAIPQSLVRFYQLDAMFPEASCGT